LWQGIKVTQLPDEPSDLKLTDDDIKNFIASNTWTFAKTMAHMPHEYCLKKKCRNPEAFERFVMHIRNNGYAKYFYRKIFMYFNVGPYQYWTMGAPLEETILINRALCGTVKYE
jgi:hypothetical protein